MKTLNGFLTATITLLIFSGTISAQTPDFSLVGFATQNGGTTGGNGGTEATVSTGDEILDLISEKKDGAYSEGLIIRVDGTITQGNSSSSKIDIKEVSDITVIGAGTNGEFDGIGIKIWKSNNIIIRNLKIHHVSDGDGDCIGIEGPSEHIWVDHCELYNDVIEDPEDDSDKDYYDGLLDAKRDVNHITYSWNHLHDSWKTMLVGSSDGDEHDRHITIHHNWFEASNSRLPLFRFGHGHIFNNYYSTCYSTGINSRMGAELFIENNVFENMNNPVGFWYSDETGYWNMSGNEYINCTGSKPTESTTDWVPDYQYAHVLHATDEVKATVTSYAGVGVIDEGDTGTDPRMYNLDVSVGEGSGTVEGTEGGSYQSGTEISLTATPADGYSFDSWSGSVNSADNPLNFSITSDMSITANFTSQNQQDPDPNDTIQINSFVTQPLTEAVFEEGCHYMLINRSSLKALDVENRSIENDAAIIAAEPEDVIHQLWRTEDQGSGCYIVNGYTDKVLKDNSGNAIQVRDGSSSTHTWNIEHVEDSYFRLINENSDNALAVSGDAVVTESYNGNENQMWQVLEVSAESEEPSFDIEGFATVGEGTTGGEGGATVTVSTAEELIDYMQRSEPYIIHISGTIEMPEGDNKHMWNVAPDKTLHGVDDAHIVGGGFNILGTRNNGEGDVTRTNIIIRNLTFSDAADDCINISQGAQNVWIDHNTFYSSNDGLVDIKREANYVTVSWNEFYDHHKTMLCGHDESHSHDRGYLKVSYHHNYFHETHSRHPRIRYGRAHLYNNYFTNIEGYVVGPGIESSTISENNHVWISNRFTDWYDETGIVADRNMNSLLGHIDHDHDLELNSVQPDWAPEDYYDYTLNSPLNVKHMVTNYAGAGIVDQTVNSNRGPQQVKSGFENSSEIRMEKNGNLQCAMTLQKNSGVELNLYSIDGRLVKSASFSGYPGRHLYAMDANSLRSGFYIVSVAVDSKVVMRQRLSIIR